jgi:uncharacterized protein (DUF362 family)
VVSRARRVLIKPSASCPLPYPVTTSADMLAAIISSIRRVSDADIILLEGRREDCRRARSTRRWGITFPGADAGRQGLHLRGGGQPAAQAFAMPTFWVPNVILSSDYLITVAPMKTYNGSGCFSIRNLLSLLPSSKYHGEENPDGWDSLYSLGIDKVLADLYFTLPFDMGIVEAKQKFAVKEEPSSGDVEEYDKVFLGEPFEADCEAAAWG